MYFFNSLLCCVYICTKINRVRPRGVTVSTLDSESSDRGSNPREALNFTGATAHVYVSLPLAACQWRCQARVQPTPQSQTYDRWTTFSDTAFIRHAQRRQQQVATFDIGRSQALVSTRKSRALGRCTWCGRRRRDTRCRIPSWRASGECRASPCPALAMNSASVRLEGTFVSVMMALLFYTSN